MRWLSRGGSGDRHADLAAEAKALRAELVALRETVAERREALAKVEAELARLELRGEGEPEPFDSDQPFAGLYDHRF